jgi:uncharacterized protein (DUF433 family)
MTALSYTPQEVAAMSGVPLSVVQKAVTAGKIPAQIDCLSHRRQLNGVALLAFALIQALPKEISISPADAYRLVKHLDLLTTDMETELMIGDLVRINAGKALAPMRRRLDLYARARELIVSDPATMGGTHTIRGTRITAQAILGRLEAGDTVASVLDDYPYLNQEMVEAAALYAMANPPRGRPAGKLWNQAS